MKSLNEITVVIICALLIVLSQAQEKRCNGGVECIRLDQCVVLHERLQKGSNQQLTNLLRSLHCGFNGTLPKLCCPPEFRSQAVAQSRSSPIPSNLLPSEKVCGIQNNNRIVGGTQADIDEHPWMALLRYNKPVGWGFYCGGVLVASKFVLTAAHCVKGSDLPPDWRLSHVRLGEYDTSTERDCLKEDCSGPVQDIAVMQIMAHEQYNPSDTNQHHDIALLKLVHKAQFNDFVKPICLPVSNELRQNTFVGVEMEVAGWGKTETRSESEIKLKVRLPVVTNRECYSVYQKVSREIINNQMCAGGEAGKDSCRGDSGGALMGQTSATNNWMVVGVVSYGPSPCGTPGWPGVYTRVGAYMDWIISKMQT